MDHEPEVMIDQTDKQEIVLFGGLVLFKAAK